MTIQTIAGAQKRRTLSLPFGGRASHMQGTNEHCASVLSARELQRLVAAMVD